MKWVFAHISGLIIMAYLVFVPDVSWASKTISLGHFDTDFVAYSVTSGDVDGDGRYEYIAGAFDHRIYVVTNKGKVLWSFDVGGLPYHMTVADVNGDGRHEIVAVVQSSPGALVVLEYKKGISWRFTADRPFLCAAVGDVDADGLKEIIVGSHLGAIYVLDPRARRLVRRVNLAKKSYITALAAGDLNGQPGDEILAGTSYNGVIALTGQGRRLWRIKPKAARKNKKKQRKTTKERHPRFKMEEVQSVVLADVTGDSEKEIIIGSRPCGMVTVWDLQGKKIWQRNDTKRFGTHASAWVVCGNFSENKKQDIFCLFNGLILQGVKGTSPALLLDGDGHELGRFESSTAFFTAGFGLPGKKTDTVLLSSSVRENGFNTMVFDQGEKFLPSYKERRPKAILAQLEKMAARKVGLSDRKKSDKDFHFLYRCHYAHIYGKSARELERLLTAFRALPGKPAIVLTSLYENPLRSLPGNPAVGSVALPQRMMAPTLKKGAKKFVSSEEILEIAQWFEQQKIPFYLNIGKHAKLYFRVRTLKKVLQIAKTSCQGFLVDENNISRTALWRSFQSDLDRVMRLLTRHPGKKLVMNEYLGFWQRFLLEPDKFQALLKAPYKDVLVPVYKPNNMKVPEVNLGVLVGLWKTGYVQNWGLGIYSDMWKWASVFIGAPGDVMLRSAVGAAALGGNYFVFARNVSADSRETLDLASPYKEYFDTFYRLVNGGIVRPLASPHQLLVSPVALHAVADPSEIAARDMGTRIYWQEIYRWRGLLDGGFLLQTARRDYLGTHLYGMEHYYDGLFPKNPYGFVCILPESASLDRAQGLDRLFVAGLDGRLMENRNGRRQVISLHQFDSAISVAGKTLPLSTDDAFLVAQKRDNALMVYCINPLMFHTENVTAYVQTHRPVQKVTDMLSGNILPQAGKGFSVDIPAGLFRILKVDVEKGQ